MIDIYKLFYHLQALVKYVAVNVPPMDVGGTNLQTVSHVPSFDWEINVFQVAMQLLGFTKTVLEFVNNVMSNATKHVTDQGLEIVQNAKLSRMVLSVLKLVHP
jgi:hypothetical protein